MWLQSAHSLRLKQLLQPPSYRLQPSRPPPHSTTVIQNTGIYTHIHTTLFQWCIKRGLLIDVYARQASASKNEVHAHTSSAGMSIKNQDATRSSLHPQSCAGHQAAWAGARATKRYSSWIFDFHLFSKKKIYLSLLMMFYREIKKMSEWLVLIGYFLNSIIHVWLQIIRPQLSHMSSIELA